jgi:hypothetical protein
MSHEFGGVPASHKRTRAPILLVMIYCSTVPLSQSDEDPPGISSLAMHPESMNVALVLHRERSSDDVIMLVR